MNQGFLLGATMKKWTEGNTSYTTMELSNLAGVKYTTMCKRLKTMSIYEAINKKLECGKSKLTDIQRKSILECKGIVKPDILAEKYCVSTSTIYTVWKCNDR